MFPIVRSSDSPVAQLLVFRAGERIKVYIVAANLILSRALRMLLTLQDDGVLRVYENVADAVRDVEALDAEQVFRAVFDDTGEMYSVQWIRRNKRGRLFRFMVSNGEYTLAPRNRKDVEALLRLLREHTVVEPQGAEKRLSDLERRLTTDVE